MAIKRPAHETATEFFDSYRDALVARDLDRIVDCYGCPALIAFPGKTILVTDPQQTRDFFEQAMGQYAAVESVTADVRVMGETEHSIWADVTWDYHDALPKERMVYQLLATPQGWRIGVLTPVAPDS